MAKPKPAYLSGGRGFTFRTNPIVLSLEQVLQLIVNDARRNASWSSTIPTAIKVGKVVQKGFIVEGSIIVDLKQAPEARAFEYGSGIHATKRDAKTYEIRPKNKEALAFYWPGHEGIRPGKKYIGLLGNGRMMFHYVDHPGVEAKPYLQPAIEAHREQFKKAMAKAFKDGYRASIQGRFK